MLIRVSTKDGEFSRKTMHNHSKELQ